MTRSIFSPRILTGVEAPDPTSAKRGSFEMGQGGERTLWYCYAAADGTARLLIDE